MVNIEIGTTLKQAPVEVTDITSGIYKLMRVLTEK